MIAQTRTVKIKLRSQLLARAIFTMSACLSASPLLGCHHHSSSTNTATDNGGLTLSAGNSISVLPATIAQCAFGGSVYMIYYDSNHNGTLDGTDPVVSTQAVCNGTTGANGLSTVMGLNRVRVGSAICASESGLQVSTGTDSNFNSVLDASEINQSQIVCDGVAGEAGASGAAGSNGHGIVMSFVSASPTSCANGGSTILMALDTSDSGIYSANDAQQESTTICNGTNGINGVNGTNGTNGINAQTPAYSTVDAIMPCGNTVANKEVLLRLANGEILASVSDNVSGANTRFSFMIDGNYMDSDGSSCNFSVSTSADHSTRSISWSGQVQQSWPIAY